MSEELMADLPDQERMVLVCDDEPHIREPVAIFLRQHGFEVDTAVDGKDGLDKFQAKDYFLVITDINMPSMTGLELLGEIKRIKPSTDVMMITGNVDLDFAIQAIKDGAYDYFRKPFDFEDVLLTVTRVVEKRKLQRQAAEAERLRGERDASEKNALEAVMALVQAVYSKDSYTRGHMERVGLYANVVAKQMGLEPERQKIIERAGLLHDIGKIGTPDVILNKAGKLTEEEFLVIQLHPNVGAQIVRPISVLGSVAPLVRQHHEKWNGRGYPDNRVGEEISVEARVLAIADVFDALHSDRAYRPGLPLEKSMQIITEGSGNHFDPEVVRCLVSCLNDGSLLSSVKDARGEGQVSAEEKVRKMAEEASSAVLEAAQKAAPQAPAPAAPAAPPPPVEVVSAAPPAAPAPVVVAANDAEADAEADAAVPAAPVAPAADDAASAESEELVEGGDDDEMNMDMTVDLPPRGS